MSKYGTKNFLRIADNLVNGEIKNLDDIQNKLTAWFCFKFNTTPNDYRLLDMTIEELLVVYQMHRIHDDPEGASEELRPTKKTYEEWLQSVMGEDYISEGDMIDQELQQQEEDKEQYKNLPDKIYTDFGLDEIEG